MERKCCSEIYRLKDTETVNHLIALLWKVWGVALVEKLHHKLNQQLIQTEPVRSLTQEWTTMDCSEDSLVQPIAIYPTQPASSVPPVPVNIQAPSDRVMQMSPKGNAADRSRVPSEHRSARKSVTRLSDISKASSANGYNATAPPPIELCKIFITKFGSIIFRVSSSC
jgi:hypothetical protein